MRSIDNLDRGLGGRLFCPPRFRHPAPPLMLQSRDTYKERCALLEKGRTRIMRVLVLFLDDQHHILSKEGSASKLLFQITGEMQHEHISVHDFAQSRDDLLRFELYG